MQRLRIHSRLAFVMALFAAVSVLDERLANAARKTPSMPAGVPNLTKETPSDISRPYNLGPTGALGWMYVERGMTEKSRQILITDVEKNSPADGVLQVGDVILGVFGEPFSEDARKSFGRAIGEAETEVRQGILKLLVWRKGLHQLTLVPQEIDLKLKAMGSYSDTAPYDCPKSKKILDEGCRFIAKDPTAGDGFHINLLALMASGNPEYQETVRKIAHVTAAGVSNMEKLWKTSTGGGMHTWGFGYTNLFLTEYYLATGDKAVLPAICAYTGCIARGQGRFGTWGHGLLGGSLEGKLHGPIPPYGPVNQAGLPCFVSLVLAEKCGVEDPELKPAIDRANKFFSYYVDKGSIPYGEHRPTMQFDENGKNSIAVVAFALQSKTAETHYFAKMVTASYEGREWGHAGSAFSYVWGPSGAHCGGPKAAAAFMKELRWYYDLARRWDGSFVFTGDGGGGGGCSGSYNGVFNATGSFLLGYALPLRKLYITGRDPDEKAWLTAQDATEAIQAGGGKGIYDNTNVEHLVQCLGSWAAPVRHWAAGELAKSKEDLVPRLMKIAEGDDAKARVGACEALGQFKQRAAPALPALIRLLSHEDRWSRVQAADALKLIGEPARAVLPEMLKLAARKDEGDLMEFGQGGLAYALFYPGGATAGSPGLLAKSIKGIDRDLLYPAVRAISRNPDSHARGCLRSTYSLLTLDDVKALAPDIIESIREIAPANAMFSKGIRIAGIQVLAKYYVEEGLPLNMMLWNLNIWGKAATRAAVAEVLKQYRGAAKSLLPELKKQGFPPEVIATIENDKNPPKLISLKDHLRKDNRSDDAGFRPLFNGKDLTGWVKQGPAGFEVKDGTLVCNGSGNYPTWLRTEEVFENFELRLEYRNLWDAEGGVFFSAPLYGRIATIGFDVRIANNIGRIRDYSPGAIFEAVPPLVEAARPPVYSDVPSDWNKLEIVMDWPKLRVTLNGQVVQDLNVEEHESLRYRPRLGYIGLQDRGKPIVFGNVEIKRLPDKQRGQWRSLCNGKNLQGWTISEKCSARWTVEDGDILAKDGHGYLVTDRQFRNCEFQTYVQTSPLANSGVFFHWKGAGDRGFEIQIEDIPDSQDPTGSIYGRVRAKCMPFQPGEWYLMQVFVKDGRCMVRVNGETVAETDALSVDRSGNISLQMHTDKGWVRFKDPRVRPLDKDTAVSQASY